MENLDKYLGHKIINAYISDDELVLKFENGSLISIYDDGQTCCESRYMTTDDDVANLIDGELLSITSREGPEDDDCSYGEHEQIFVEVQSSKGHIVLVNHNAHNGYYGGFDVRIREIGV